MLLEIQLKLVDQLAMTTRTVESPMLMIQEERSNRGSVGDRLIACPSLKEGERHTICHKIESSWGSNRRNNGTLLQQPRESPMQYLDGEKGKTRMTSPDQISASPTCARCIRSESFPLTAP